MAMIPALLTRISSGPSQLLTNARTECRSDKSSCLTWICWLPVVCLIFSAVCVPASILRTASITSAPDCARARAVSTPMPLEPPVTSARFPRKCIPSMTSIAVVVAPNGVVINSAICLPPFLIILNPSQYSRTQERCARLRPNHHGLGHPNRRLSMRGSVDVCAAAQSACPLLRRVPEKGLAFRLLSRRPAREVSDRYASLLCSCQRHASLP